MKVPRAVGSDKPIADGKGVHREVESERSPRQTFGPTNRNFVRHLQVDKAALQAEVESKTNRIRNPRTNVSNGSER